MEYISIFSDNPNYDPLINLGYMEDGEKSHFVLITNLSSVLSEKYRKHKKLICTPCNTTFGTREALLNHEKLYHSTKELPIIKLPTNDKAYINFDITRESDLKKTVLYPFVCYADFEASTKVVNGKTIQVPNSYVIFSPELMTLRDDRLHYSSFLKTYYDDDPEMLMRNFVDHLKALHTSHKFRMTSNAKVPRLTPEEEQKYNSARVCENCKKEFGTRREDGTEVRKVRHHDHVTNKFVGAWCTLCNIRNNNRYLNYCCLPQLLRLRWSFHHQIRY
jgi:hypothetical protein